MTKPDHAEVAAKAVACCIASINTGWTFDGQRAIELIRAAYAEPMAELERLQEESVRYCPSCTAEELKRLRAIVDLLTLAENGAWDIRSVPVPTGGGDADVGWEIIAHHMDAPKEREIGFGMTIVEALKAAEAWRQQ